MTNSLTLKELENIEFIQNENCNRRMSAWRTRYFIQYRQGMILSILF